MTVPISLDQCISQTLSEKLLFTVDGNCQNDTPIAKMNRIREYRMLCSKEDKYTNPNSPRLRDNCRRGQKIVKAHVVDDYKGISSKYSKAAAHWKSQQLQLCKPKKC